VVVVVVVVGGESSDDVGVEGDLTARALDAGRRPVHGSGRSWGAIGVGRTAWADDDDAGEARPGGGRIQIEVVPTQGAERAPAGSSDDGELEELGEPSVDLLGFSQQQLDHINVGGRLDL
jgi:hypothetical protein